MRAVALPCAALALVACGGGVVTSTSDDAGTDAFTSNDAFVAHDSAINVDSSSPLPCPASLPAGGSACSVDALECEYGPDPRVFCNDVATCTNGAWSIRPAADCGPVQIGGGGGCPATEKDVLVGQGCNTPNLFCEYASGICACGLSGHPPSQVWVCDEPSNPSCPFPRPKLGTVCSNDPQLVCDYGSCTGLGGDEQVCSSGTWHQQMVACPP